jgi:pumilio homology domain family member 6
VAQIAQLCPSHRTALILELKGQVIRLLLHREASRVVADIYELHANAYERALLLREFYGRETMLLSGSVTAGSDEDKMRARKGLKGVLEDADVAKRKRVLSAIKENLDLMYVKRYILTDQTNANIVNRFNNPDKGSVRYAIVHRAFWEYLSEVNGIPDETERDKLRYEAFERSVFFSYHSCLGLSSKLLL